jgi:signal transduction histidine kinase
MSYPYIGASSEFAALCQSQMRLLSQGFGCVWSAVYLTEEFVEGQQGQLTPFAIYPPSKEAWQENFPPLSLPEVWQKLNYQSRLLATSSLPGTAEAKTTNTTEWEKSYQERQQLIMPLIYEDVVMGLLIMARKKRDWDEKELRQIEEIADTIALGRFLDRRQKWYQTQLATQTNLRQVEQDRLAILLHQLRNPLTALRTFSKLLLKRLLPEDRNHSVAQNILRESNHLEELLKQFETNINIDNQQQENTALALGAASTNLSSVDFSRQSNFLLPSNSSKSQLVDIKEILVPLLMIAEAIATERKIKLSADLPDTLPTVVANDKALREIFNNLLDNALKYTPAGGRLEVGIKTSPQENRLGIAIRDTGYGIPKEEQERIFERHYRGIQESGDLPGSGLGLAIAKELLAQMKAEIELISPNGLGSDPRFPGTTFIVWLPLSNEA